MQSKKFPCLRIISEDRKNDKPVYDKVWPFRWSTTADLHRSIIHSLDARYSDQLIFRNVFEKKIGPEVILRDVLSILEAGKPTMWLQADYQEMSATLIVTRAPERHPDTREDYFGQRRGAAYIDSYSQAKSKREKTKLPAIAQTLFERDSGRGNAFIPFWEQQPWCRHVAIRMLAAEEVCKD